MRSRPVNRQVLPYSKNTIILGSIACAIILIVFIIHSCTTSDTNMETRNTDLTSQASSSEVRVLLAGDAVVHESVYMDAENTDGTYDFAKQLDAVTDIAHNYDLAFYNQESILGGPDLGISGYPTFNAPQEFGDYMVKKGFNLVSTANNHSLDRRYAGIKASRHYWNKQANVLTDGTNAEESEQRVVPSMEKNGIKIGFVAYCENTNGIYADYDWEVNYSSIDEEKMLDRIRTAKNANDVVIVSVHWGDEYSKDVNARQTSLAKKIVEAGGDIIVGNHPHVVQPFQWIDGKPVFYAMGNLISSQTSQENLVGMMTSLSIKKSETGTITFENLQADLTYTLMDGKYPDLRTNVQVKPLKSVTDAELASQMCNKNTNFATELYNETTDRLKSFDDNITIGGIWDN